MKGLYYFDEMLRSKVEEADRQLHDGKYAESRRVIDAVYFMLGTKNIVELNFPFPISQYALINLLTVRAQIYLVYHDYGTADSMLTMTAIITRDTDMPPKERVRLLLLKSNVMVMPNPLEHSLGLLSDALKIAESSGDRVLVTMVYMEMGKFMASEYTALGLSLIRKVETYCKRNKMKEGEIGAKVYRARCSYMMWTHDKYSWVKDRERFAKETVRLLDSINPDEIKSQYNRDIYLGLKRDIEQYQQTNTNDNRLGQETGKTDQ